MKVVAIESEQWFDFGVERVEVFVLEGVVADDLFDDVTESDEEAFVL